MPSHAYAVSSVTFWADDGDVVQALRSHCEDCARAVSSAQARILYAKISTQIHVPASMRQRCAGSIARRPSLNVSRAGGL